MPATKKGESMDELKDVMKYVIEEYADEVRLRLTLR